MTIQTPVALIEIRCAFCRGSGKDPFGVFSHLSTCCICGGSGTGRVEEPYVQCAYCRGTGAHPHSRLTCTASGGAGVSPVEAPHRQCPDCSGIGVDLDSEPGLYCLTCHGAGTIKGSE